MSIQLEANMETTTKILTPADIQRIRADFPVLSQEVYGKPLVYLDNAATTQKPQVMIDRISDYYGKENGTVRRGVYRLSEQSARDPAEGKTKKPRFWQGLKICSFDD